MMPPPNSPKWIAMRHNPMNDTPQKTDEPVDPFGVFMCGVAFIILGIITFLLISKFFGVISFVFGLFIAIVAFIPDNTSKNDTSENKAP